MVLVVVRLLLLASLVVAAPACVAEVAEVADQTEPWIPYDVDPTESIERLGDDGYKMLCRSFDGYVRDIYRSELLVKAACTAHALQTTANASECATATESCLGTMPPVVEEQLDRIVEQAGCSDAFLPQTKCRSPVHELLRCLKDLRAGVDHVGQTLTCAAFGSPPTGEWWHIETPQSCIALATSCPKS